VNDPDERNQRGVEDPELAALGATDLYSVNSYDGEFDLILVIAGTFGSSLSISDGSAAWTGTVKVMAEGFYRADQPFWQVEGLNISAAAIQSVIYSASNATILP
jgi:hypothetical protein